MASKIVAQTPFEDASDVGDEWIQAFAGSDTYQQHTAFEEKMGRRFSISALNDG